MEKSGIDPATTFPAAQLDYTQYEGNQCALPLLSDAYGLYYNKDAFKAAGITGAAQDPLGVRRRRGQADQDVGRHLLPARLHAELPRLRVDDHPLRRPVVADVLRPPTASRPSPTDPAFAAMLEWQKDLVDKLGGYDKLEKYRTTFGDEFGAKNPFMTGQVAMAIDGEWRAGMIDDANSDVELRRRAVPGARRPGRPVRQGLHHRHDRRASRAPARSRTPPGSSCKYLTTDTDAVVNFANAIHNVPSTKAALASPDVDQDPSFQTFIKIAQNPNSNTTPASPNGGAYQLTLQNLGYDYESGKQTDLQAGPGRGGRSRSTPTSPRRSERDRRPATATAERPPALRGTPAPGAAAQPRVPVALAARAPGCSSSTRWSRRPTSRSPTTTASARRRGTGWTTGSSSSATTRSSGRRCATRCGSSW